MQIALLGYGKMGKSIETIGIKKGHTFPLKIDSSNQHELTPVALQSCDVAIEFSVPETAVKHLMFCIDNQIPVVCGTTGWLEKKNEVEKMCREKNATLLHTSNFSLGVNLFFEFVDYMTKRMARFGDYSIAVSESHHTEKKDKPSGTALSIADIIFQHTDYEQWKIAELGKQHAENVLAIDCIRKQDVVGIHDVCFISDIDRLTLSHTAFSREGFALGALKAAEFICNKKGVFTMQDVLKG